jgi:hypothetical protein
MLCHSINSFDSDLFVKGPGSNPNGPAMDYQWYRDARNASACFHHAFREGEARMAAQTTSCKNRNITKARSVASIILFLACLYA